jgi:hypothetical protein
MADRVVAQRLRTQRLTSAPLDTAADAVELLTCVQAQERDHAFFSLALRSGDSTREAVRAGFDRGEFVRTHILRPTWHFVRPEDLRWILSLTSPRVESSMASVLRGLGLDEARTIDRGLDLLRELLTDRRYLTRAQIGTVFAARGSALPQPGGPLGHLLMIAELRGIICSGPLTGVHHTYALVDELVPPSPELDRDAAVRRLAHRFFVGHGPASVADFARWSSLPAGETRRALDELDDLLERITAHGVEHWFDPVAVPRRGRAVAAAWLLPVYDEAVLTYRATSFAPAPGHPYADRPDPFWAPVIHGRTNIGLWKRTVGRGRVTVETRLASSLEAPARRDVAAAAARLADFLGLTLDYVEGTGTPKLWGGPPR